MLYFHSWLHTATSDSTLQCITICAVQASRGKPSGFRVDVLFVYHQYAPDPLDKNGCYGGSAMTINGSTGKGCGGVAQPHTQEGWPNKSKMPLPLLGVLPPARSAKPEATQVQQDHYNRYRAQMHLWKEERAAELGAKKNYPFQVASRTEKPTELRFRFPALKAWCVACSGCIYAAPSCSSLHQLCGVSVSSVIGVGLTII